MTEPTNPTMTDTLPLAPEEPTMVESTAKLDPESTDEDEEDSGSSSKAKKKRAEEAAGMLGVDLPSARPGGAPHWAELPPNFTFPRGKQILFLRFKSTWTDAPWKGEPMIDSATGEFEVDAHGKEVLYRQCVCWPINTADKKLALGRAQRDPNRAADELAKQMIRVHDGHQCDWEVVRPGGVEMFWNEIGEKCRGLVLRIFTQLHVLDTDSTRDFLTNCIEVRSTGS